MHKQLSNYPWVNWHCSILPNKTCNLLNQLLQSSFTSKDIASTVSTNPSQNSYRLICQTSLPFASRENKYWQFLLAGCYNCEILHGLPWCSNMMLERITTWLRTTQMDSYIFLKIMVRPLFYRFTLYVDRTGKSLSIRRWHLTWEMTSDSEAYFAPPFSVWPSPSSRHEVLSHLHSLILTKRRNLQPTPIHMDCAWMNLLRS